MNNDFFPKFTVLIPTKDRSDYLFHTLKTCTSQNYPNFEIVVSDDGSTDNTREVVENVGKHDSRVKYITPGKNVGMLENFEFALNHVQEGFVIALGGDDGLLPHSIEKMHDLLSISKQQMLAWPTPTFFYPNVKMSSGQFIFPFGLSKLKNSFKIVNSDVFLKRQYTDLSYLTDIESPMFYVKAVVSIDLIKSVKSKTINNRFYSCPTPDGYSGIVLAGEVESWAFTDTPLSMHGVSPTSQGNAYLSNNINTNNQSEQFFRHVSNIPMHKDLASQQYSPLISLMTADYLLTVKDLPGWKGAVDVINFQQLLIQGIGELKDGLFPKEKINRELKIMYQIAKYHNLENFYISLVNKSKRNSRIILEGNAISPKRIYLNSIDFRIENIFDASYFAYNLISLKKNFNFLTLKSLFNNSFNYFRLGHKTNSNFPDQSNWSD